MQRRHQRGDLVTGIMAACSGAPGLAAETGQDLLQRITASQSDHVAALQPNDRNDHR
jgi:hypothetical protein